jgi:hypothetical protein
MDNEFLYGSYTEFEAKLNRPRRLISASCRGSTSYRLHARFEKCTFPTPLRAFSFSGVARTTSNPAVFSTLSKITPFSAFSGPGRRESSKPSVPTSSSKHRSGLKRPAPTRLITREAAACLTCGITAWARLLILWSRPV